MVVGIDETQGDTLYEQAKFRLLRMLEEQKRKQGPGKGESKSDEWGKRLNRTDEKGETRSCFQEM